MDDRRHLVRPIFYPPPLAIIHPAPMSGLSEVAPRGWVALRLMATGLAGRTHLSAQKNMMAEDESEGGREGRGRTRGRGEGERGRFGEEEGTCIRHAPVLSSYGAIY